MNRLLLITIGAYEHWGALRGPPRDGESLKAVLFAKYGFAPERTVELRDAQATHGAIRKALRQLKTAPPDDQLLIYYAGHGHTDEFDGTGFWIPHDAGVDTLQQQNWLPITSVRGALSALPFRHILLICDSCFSGDMLDEQRDLGAERTPGYVATAGRKRSREVLTSGSSEPVSDAGLDGHSAFAFHLVDTLKNCRDPWVDGLRLYDHIRSGVRGQQPLYGGLTSAGHQKGGAMILFPEPCQSTQEVPRAEKMSGWQPPSAEPEPRPPRVRPPPRSPPVPWRVDDRGRPIVRVTQSAARRRFGLVYSARPVKSLSGESP